jgi:tripartite-type tricarboxylate transporter receptor subunit TctC
MKETKSIRAALVAAFALVVPTVAASAEQYPTRPISFVVPFAAGGATDALARQFAERMGRGAGQQIIVENVAGAGGTLGAARVARSNPDGYTFLVGHVGYMAAAPGLYKKLPYDPVKDFEAVARFPDTPMVLVTGSGGRFKSVQAVIDFARQNPGSVNIGNAGVGSAGHLVAALFSSTINAEVTHIAYKGNAPAMIDLVSGRIDGLFDQSNTALPHVNGGKVAALATTSSERLPLMPNVPTMIEMGFDGFKAATWYGVYAPKGTAPQRLEWLYARFQEAMDDEAFMRKLVAEGYVPIAPSLRTGEALFEHTKREGEIWKGVIEKAGIPAN